MRKPRCAGSLTGIVVCPVGRADSEMIVIGYILLVLGCFAGLYWQLRFLAIAYRRSAWWLFGCLFLPFVDWIFLFLNFRATRKPFGLSLAGLIIAGLGAWMVGVVGPH